MKSPGIILTPEQKILRQHALRMGHEGQASRYSVAISRALNAANEDLQEEGGKPSLQAVLEALAGGAAYYCCQAGADTVEALIQLFETALRDQVEEILRRQQEASAKEADDASRN